MHLFRVVVAWSGNGVVGSAVNVLHFDASNQTSPPVAAIKTAFQNLSGAIAPGTTITIPNSGDIIEDTTGALTGVWTGTGGGSFTGTSDPRIAAGAGACIGWTTGGIVMGKKGPRKLRGRTFLVPLGASSYDSDGTLQAGTKTGCEAVGTGLIAAGGLAVWHRPTTPGGSDGNSYAVLSSKVRDKVAFLSSRRD